MDSLPGFSRLVANAAVQTPGSCVQNYSAARCPIAACPEARHSGAPPNRHVNGELRAKYCRSIRSSLTSPPLPPPSYPVDSARYQWLAFPIIENQTDMGQKVIGPR